MYFKVTLTTTGGLSKPNLVEIKKYFSQCTHAYLTVEYGANGDNCHVEGCVEFSTVNTSNVTNRMKTLYCTMGLEWGPFAVKVKKATHLIGAIIYASKEIKEKGELLLLKGWKQSWIDQQIKDNVKSIPHKMLKSKGTRVTQNTGGALMYEYAVANNMRVRNKAEYLEVVEQMGNQNYLFGAIRHKGVFQDVCALFGDGSAAAACAEAELHWL